MYFVSSVKGCILNPIVDQRRNSFNVQKHFQPPLLPHFIDRTKIYHDVMALFSKDDGGGVCRDMFLGFWNEAYKLFFDGSSLLVPVLHPNVDMLSLPKLGAILSHG